MPAFKISTKEGKDGVELDDATYSMLEGFASELGLGTLPATGCEKTDI